MEINLKLYFVNENNNVFVLKLKIKTQNFRLNDDGRLVVFISANNAASTS